MREIANEFRNLDGVVPFSALFIERRSYSFTGLRGIGLARPQLYFDAV
jgi:hypothetical protein